MQRLHRSRHTRSRMPVSLNSYRRNTHAFKLYTNKHFQLNSFEALEKQKNDGSPSIRRVKRQSPYAKVQRFWGSLYVSFVYANRTSETHNTRQQVKNNQEPKLKIGTYI